MYSLGHEQASWLAELGGAHWGLLPALFSLPGLTWALGPENGRLGAFVLLAALMAAYDLASFRIPNPLTATAAAYGLLSATALGGLEGLGWGVLAGLAAFGLMAVFFFFGAMGAGDVKAMAGLACFLTPWGALELFVLTALCGGVLAVGRLLLARQRVQAWGAGPGLLRISAGGHRLPYGLAIMAAALVMAAQGGLA